MAEKKKQFVDADALIVALQNINTYPHVGYAAGTLDTAVNEVVRRAVGMALHDFRQSLIHTVNAAAAPYDKCMLCIQRDCDIKPEKSY